MLPPIQSLPFGQEIKLPSDENEGSHTGGWNPITIRNIWLVWLSIDIPFLIAVF